MTSYKSLISRYITKRFLDIYEILDYENCESRLQVLYQFDRSYLISFTIEIYF